MNLDVRHAACFCREDKTHDRDYFSMSAAAVDMEFGVLAELRAS